MRFKDREDAGKRLAEKLFKYKEEKPLVLALPRGGVPIGFEVAKALGAPLDTIVARKIGAPSNPELGVGAIAPSGVLIFNSELLQFLGLKKEDLQETIKKEKEEMERRITAYQSGQWSKNLSAETLIVVDDGLATGVTARAALKSAKIAYQPKKLIFVSPVCAEDSLESLKFYADEIICILKPENLTAIGEWYENFPQISDKEVLYYLDKANG